MELDPFAPPTGRRRHWFLWSAVTLGVLIGGSLGYLWWSVYRVNSSDSTVVAVEVPAGASSVGIARQLKAAGVIRHPWLFAVYASFTGQGNRLQAGAHHLPRNLTLPQVLKYLTTSTRRAEITLTILEGWSNHDVAAYLAAQGIATVEEFNRVVRRKAPWWDAYDFLSSRPADRDLEGYLFPDTYRIFPDTPLEVLVRKMLDNFDRKLTAELRAEIQRQGKTIHEVLTLASIIEREVPDGPDRPKVAGIFQQRFALGMPLQSDATVNYVTGKKTPRPSADDLQRESLYNTYMHRGLPPGPINNPGLSAIRAALYPQASPYLYYLTTPDGTVVYSASYEEHVRAKARYYP